MPINNPSRVEIIDEAISKGFASRIALVGAGVVAAVVGDLATITIAGGSGGATMTDFTKDLGSARRSGTFDITGLSGLTADKVVSVVQTAAKIATKGDARDEAEMDLITVTGYVVDATTIRCSWFSANGSVVVGTYAFAYSVNG